MARSHVNQFSAHPYHITGRTANRIPFHLPLEQTWEILSDQLFLAHHLDGLRIHNFVLMPNHFHLIASVTEKPLAIAMLRLMRDSSREFNNRTGRINQNWGGRHYKCEISSYHYFMNAYKYTYQNPLRGKLCQKVEEWPYSSIHGLVGNSRLPFPVTLDSLLFPSNNVDLTHLNWLNQPTAEAQNEDMKKALIKKSFQFPKSHNGRANPLEIEKL